jgi:hypothetical protein
LDFIYWQYICISNMVLILLIVIFSCYYFLNWNCFSISSLMIWFFFVCVKFVLFLFKSTFFKFVFSSLSLIILVGLEFYIVIFFGFAFYIMIQPHNLYKKKTQYFSKILLHYKNKQCLSAQVSAYFCIGTYFSKCFLLKKIKLMFFCVFRWFWCVDAKNKKDIKKSF